jgi:hypothetical protein
VSESLLLIAFGCIGGLLPDIIRLAKNRYIRELPQYLRSASFYIGLLMMIVLGGLAAYLLNAGDAKQALLYGYSAPELIARLAANISETSIERALNKPTTVEKIRAWWAI